MESSSTEFDHSLNPSSHSIHLHSTTRRIFIGPTPVNWSYKKKSLLFQKSYPSVPIINKKRERKRETFVTSRESFGPTNLSSLDYYDIISKSQRNSLDILLFPESREPSDIVPGLCSNHNNNTVKSSSKTLEKFYTPTDELNSLFNNTKDDQTYLPSSSKLEKNNEISSSIEGAKSKENEDKKINKDFEIQTDIINTNPIEESHNVDEHVVQENDDINHETVLSTDKNLEIDDGNIEQSCFGFFNLTEPKKLKESSDKVIKQESMLIRIDCEENYSEEEFIPIDSVYHINKYGTWEELLVKLKPGMIELYKNKDKLVESIYFTPTTRLSILSSSDYTISIKKSLTRCTKNFILNPSTISSSIQWYQTLYKLFPELVNKSIPDALDVVIPDLDVKLRIPVYDNSNDMKRVCEDNEDNGEFTLLRILNISSKKVMDVVLNELSDITEWDDVLNKWVKSNNLKLCWKRYEKLEWIDSKENEHVWDDLLRCPQFIEQTHQLQLRPIEHYPTTVKLNDGTKLTEPSPIEGYLIKMTNNKGQKRRSRRLYFTSHNYYLFFLNPLKASPPPLPNISTNTTDDDGIQLCDNAQQNPLIYAVSPYIQDKIIGDNNIFMKSDMKRRIRQILHANGFINLTEIVKIKCLKNDGITEEDSEENFGEEEEQVDSGEGGFFQLILKNGGIVSLKAYSKQTRKEWVNHLNELIVYWKARLKEDAKIKVDIIKKNKPIYREENDELHDRNWENFKSCVDPILWNWCILDGCRGITKSGLLYQNKRFRQPFQLYHHILTRGYFIYFNHHVRSTLTGCVLNRSYYERKGCIDLKDCYVYSGRIIEHEFHKHKSYNQNNLAKVYDDGMISYDDYRDTCFVICKSKRKYYFSNDGTRINMEKKVRYGIPGKIWIFKTRNRIECEEWVWALNVEIERLHEKGYEKII